MKKLIVAIDGVSASGKGVLAKRIAEHYNCSFLPTGNLYRIVAIEVINKNIDYHDKDNVSKILNMSLKDLKDANLHNDEISDMASRISSISVVREALNEFQREWIAKHKVAVIEGRDIGTVICPEADVKIFLTADLKVRSKRREKDLINLGLKISYEDVYKELKNRDFRDSSRANAPLKKAEDAQILDSTNLTIDQTVEKAVEIIEKKIDNHV
jgi:CMP/dCMP kinase